MLAALVEAKLRALQYPHLVGFDLYDDVKVAQLVLWLENRKIRQYPPAERDGLDYSKNNPNKKEEQEDDDGSSDNGWWRANLQKYLSDLVCAWRLACPCMRAHARCGTVSCTLRSQSWCWQWWLW